MYVLVMYDRSVDSVQCLIGDNCSTNKLLANLMQVPLVGCASHRLNLAVKKIYEDNIELIEKVDEIMANLNNLKNRIILGEQTALHPKTANLTRWSSTYNMLV